MAEETTEQQSTWLTHDAFDRLTEELRRRKDTDRKEIAARVEAARQEGDLRENAGYGLAGKEQRFALGGQEITADVPDGVKVFSPDAPLGKALMGHRAGETVTYAAPTGKEIKAEIVDVTRV